MNIKLTISKLVLIIILFSCSSHNAENIKKNNINADKNICYVNALNGCNLKSNPNNFSNTIVFLHYNDSVKIINELQELDTIGVFLTNWVKIKFNEKVGYFPKLFLSNFKLPVNDIFRKIRLEDFLLKYINKNNYEYFYKDLSLYEYEEKIKIRNTNIGHFYYNVLLLCEYNNYLPEILSLKTYKFDNTILSVKYYYRNGLLIKLKFNWVLDIETMEIEVVQDDRDIIIKTYYSAD